MPGVPGLGFTFAVGWVVVMPLREHVGHGRQPRVPHRECARGRLAVVGEHELGVLRVGIDPHRRDHHQLTGGGFVDGAGGDRIGEQSGRSPE